jgi:hypothetical protein
MGKTGTWLAGIVLGLTLGLASTLLVNRPEVKAADKKPKWEYKVVGFSDKEDQEKAKLLQKLADEGWEYVGLISTDSLAVDVRASLKNSDSSVAFKRPKK